MSVYYKVSSAWVPVSVPFYRAGGLSTQPKSVYYKVSGTWTKIYPFTGYHIFAAGTMTKGSTSSGTTTVTTQRGGLLSGAVGLYTNDFSSTPTIAGVLAHQSTGAITRERSTYISTSQIDSITSIYASIDGGTWYEFKWGLDPFENETYHSSVTNGLVADPFGLYSMANDTVKKVLIAVAD